MIILTQPEMADKAIVLFGLDDDNDKADDDDVEEDKKNAYLFARTPGSGLLFSCFCCYWDTSQASVNIQYGDIN